jgi:hypothetical protein
MKEEVKRSMRQGMSGHVLDEIEKVSIMQALMCIGSLFHRFDTIVEDLLTVS